MTTVPMSTVPMTTDPTTTRPMTTTMNQAPGGIPRPPAGLPRLLPPAPEDLRGHLARLGPTPYRGRPGLQDHDPGQGRSNCAGEVDCDAAQRRRGGYLFTRNEFGLDRLPRWGGQR